MDVPKAEISLLGQHSATPHICDGPVAIAVRCSNQETDMREGFEALTGVPSGMLIFGAVVIAVMVSVFATITVKGHRGSTPTKAPAAKASHARASVAADAAATASYLAGAIAAGTIAARDADTVTAGTVDPGTRSAVLLAMRSVRGWRRVAPAAMRRVWASGLVGTRLGVFGCGFNRSPGDSLSTFVIVGLEVPATHRGPARGASTCPHGYPARPP